MRVVGMTILHYGAQYLGYAIRSVIDHVDAHYVFYTDQGSHGSRTSEPCPETRDELIAIAQNAAGDKLRWYEGHYDYEGQHRERIHHYEPDADMVVVVDADEVWSEELIKNALFHLGHETVRNIRVPIIHYWRSFYKCVTHDPAYPTRIIFPRIDAKYGESTWHKGAGCIHHFGYAQTPAIVRYKWLIHGHRGELRQDIDWFKDVYMANRQTDTHPVGSDFWNPETVDPFALGLPEYMKDHPFAGMEVIE